MRGFRLDGNGGLVEVVEIAQNRAGEPVIPAGVFVSPDIPEAMTLAEGQKLVLVDGQWQVMEDHIGEKYWLPGDEYGTDAHVMEAYGPLPEGASTTEPAAPTAQELWLKEISGKSSEELRSWLYSTCRYRFLDDDLGKGKDESVPMCLVEGKAMTVDEASQDWLRYVGDNDEIAQEAMAQKIAAKAYIRDAVAAYGKED